MQARMLLTAAMATISLVFAAGCAQTPAKKNSLETASQETKAPVVIGTHYTTIIFEKGKSNLTADGRELLRELSRKAHGSDRKIEEIKILAWADEEYPDPAKAKASTKEIILASQRAQSVRDFLENDLEEKKDIDSFNMARRPDFLSKLFRNEEYEVKKSFEMTGTTASRLPSGEISFTKASKAIVIIDYEGEEDNLK